VNNILQEIETQDNRFTRLPIYYVIKRKRWEPCWEEQADKHLWITTDDGIEFEEKEELIDMLISHGYAEEDEREDLENYDELDFEDNYDVSYVPCKYVEYESEFDPIFFTEKRAKAFL
jgi:hypothetical protein